MFPHCQKITDAADVAECKGGCGYPMCSESCGDVREHRDFECAAFRERGYKVRKEKKATCFIIRAGVIPDFSQVMGRTIKNVFLMLLVTLTMSS